MIKILTAYTNELDNPEKAVAEILNQLDLDGRLLKNSAALLFSHIKFIETGITEAVCKNLPFDTVGCTSLIFAMSTGAGMEAGAAGEIMLTATVLTSDEITFAAGLSDPLTTENADNMVNSFYQKTASVFGGEADLVFAFPPAANRITGDVSRAALDRACNHLPVFGSLALDLDSQNFRSPKTIFNGAAYDDRMAMLLFKGQIKPQFHRIPCSGQSIFSQDAIITAAEGNRIISINNEPAADYIREIGLLHGDINVGSMAIPLVIADKDSTETKVVIIHNIDEDGALHCGRDLHAGGVLNIGTVTADYVLETANILVNEIKKNENGAGVIIFSCFLRCIALGGNLTAEIELIRRELKDYPYPYLLVSSGGELCPEYLKPGKTANKNDEYALIACQFQAVSENGR